MADTTTVNPLAWNFNAFDYLTPTELRSGNQMPYSFNPSVFNSSPTAGQGGSLYGNQFSTNPFGNYSSIGMSGIFNDSLSLCNFADTFTAQTAPVIAQAKAYREQMYAQGLYQAQQASALRDQLRTMGINPDSVLNQNQFNTNNQSSQLGSLLGLLGLGGTANTSTTGNGQLDQLAQALGLGGATAANTSNASTDQLGSLLGLLGLGGTTAKKPVNDWWNRTDSDSKGSNDDAFWDYIDSKVAQSRQQNQLQQLLSLLNGA